MTGLLDDRREGDAMRLDDLLASETVPLNDAARIALAALRLRAKREASCPTCHGYGRSPTAGLPAVGEGHAAQVMV